MKYIYQYTDIEWNALDAEIRDAIDMQSGIQGPPFAYHSNCWHIKTAQALASGLDVPIEAIRRLAQTYGGGARLGGEPTPENATQWELNQQNILKVAVERNGEESGAYTYVDYVENCINHDSSHSYDKILHLDKALQGRALYTRYYELHGARVGAIVKQNANTNMETDLAYFAYCTLQAPVVYDAIIALAAWETAKRDAYYAAKENKAQLDETGLNAAYRETVEALGPRPIPVWPYKSFRESMAAQA